MAYKAIMVLCPFYKDETERAIRCEGAISDTCTNTFKGSGEKNTHKEIYCCKDYNQCEHSKGVMNKYI